MQHAMGGRCAVLPAFGGLLSCLMTEISSRGTPRGIWRILVRGIGRDSGVRQQTGSRTSAAANAARRRQQRGCRRGAAEAAAQAARCRQGLAQAAAQATAAYSCDRRGCTARHGRLRAGHPTSCQQLGLAPVS